MDKRKPRYDDRGLCLLYNRWRAYAPAGTIFNDRNRVYVSHDYMDQHIVVKENPQSDYYELWEISVSVALCRAKERDNLNSIFGFDRWEKEGDNGI